MKVSRIGEFGLIAALSRITSAATNEKWQSLRQITVGMGDDAAVWKTENPFQIATVDSMVEGIHFTLKTITWRELGWKSLAVNLSDIAAMGGVPLYAFVSIGLPADTLVEDVTALYEGMTELASMHEVAVAGGDTVTSPVVFISVTVIGRASNDEGRVLTRSAAQPGDKVAVTGELGASAAGLRMLLEGRKFPARATAELRRAHDAPTPRLAEGRKLVSLGVKAGMDISDGLIGDLTHICDMSRVSARVDVDRVPVSRAVTRCFGERARGFALSGGEDYELLFTAPARIMARAEKTLGCPVSVVGEIIPSGRRKPRVHLVNGHGDVVDLKHKGWDHFST